jgi:hypothetical protein
MEGGQEGGKEHGGGAKKGGRGKAFTFPELMCCMWAALGTNERFSAGAAKAVRLQSFNTAYTHRVKWMKEHDKWRDQYGNPVTDVTPEESIGLRVHEVDTKTNQTPISYQQARIITVCRNELAPLLDKIVDKDGKIPSGKQVSDIQEELRVAYFNSLTSDNPPEPVSSEDEATKAERLDILATARTNKLLKFHPMELGWNPHHRRRAHTRQNWWTSCGRPSRKPSSRPRCFPPPLPTRCRARLPRVLRLPAVARDGRINVVQMFMTCVKLSVM